MNLDVSFKDFVDAKFEKAVRIFDRSLRDGTISTSSKQQLCGVMLFFWMQMIKDKKIEISREEFLNYVQIDDDDECDEWLRIFLKAGFLEKSDGRYLITYKQEIVETSTRISENNRRKANIRWALEEAKLSEKEHELGISKSENDDQKVAKKRKKQSCRRHENDAGGMPVASETMPAASKNMPPILSYPDLSCPNLINTKDLNTSATTETGAEIIHLPSASGDVWHDVKNSPTDLKTTKKAKIKAAIEKPSQAIKQRWFELYRQNYANSEYPQWGARHNTCANKLLDEATGGMPAILENMERYFSWRKRQVVNSGATFCEGYSSFCFSYTQLVNDFTKPERHLEVTAEDSLWQKRRQKAEQDTLDAAMRLLEQEANNGSKASGF